MSTPAAATANGPKYLDGLGKDADDSRTLVDLLCRRVIRPDFDAGKIPGRVSGAMDLLERYVPRDVPPEDARAEVIDGFMMRAVTEDEWDQICQRLHSWQDELETSSGSYDRSALSKILLKYPKFPTVDKVESLLGEEIADDYKRALEAIEADQDTFAEFPEEKTSGGWNRHTAERAVALVTDVIVPHANSPEDMAAAYGKYMEELRSQTREKKVTQNATKEARKAVARSTGIWLPLQADADQWENDPRTCDRAPEFSKLVIKVTDKMRILRTILQFIPRRKFSNHTVADLDANMERMRNYMKDSENKRKRKMSPGSAGSDFTNSGDEEPAPAALDAQKKKRKIEQ